MTKQEFSVFASAMRTYFPKESILPNSQAMELWYRQLQDIPCEVAEVALQKWVSVNKWSPSIADIRELAASICGGEISDWGESWEKVISACRRYGRNRALEAMESFDDITREAVKRVGGFIYICNSENIVADRARYEQVYNALAERKKKENQIPLPVHEVIQRIQQHGMLQIEGAEE